MLNLILNRKQRYSLKYCVGKPVIRYNRPVYVLGDSHAFFFSGINNPVRIPVENPHGVLNTARGLLPIFRIFHLGPGLAYNLNRDGSSNRTREKIRFLVENRLIPEKSTLMLCFGEIDCRVHLPLKVNGEIEQEPHLLNVVTAYYELVDWLHSKGHEVLCWSPVATQGEECEQNKEFPRNGTERERNRITRHFGHVLKGALDGKARVVSIFKHLVDEQDRTLSHWFYDGCHLSNRALPLLGAELRDQDVIDVRNFTLRVRGPGRY